MSEETIETVKPVKVKSQADKLASGVFGYVIGFLANQLAEKAYDKLIVEGRLKAFLRRK